jgi:diaminohydroxyphosphoribosylaminopyrimidine deaminase/5-amino-6-(5-phosphoribosylamino)uracil reductase
MADPNPRVAGAGLARLRAAGIEVHLGQYAAAAWELNRGFCTRHERGRPWFRLKVASSADGRVGIKGGNNRWITGSAARRDVHRLRAQSCAVLTASGTVLADDPELTVRHVKTPRQPTRVVLDRRASVPASARIFSAAAPLLLVHAEALEGRQSGIPSCFLPVAEDGIDLAALARELARREFNEVLVEAGPRINAAFVASGLVDEIVLYLAPSLLGADALASFALHGLADVNAAPRFNLHEVRRVGEDLRLGFRQRP